MRRLLSIWLGGAAIVACGMQIDLGSPSSSAERDAGTEAGPGSSSGSPSDAMAGGDSVSPPPACLGESLLEGFIRDAGADADGGEWEPRDAGWTTLNSANDLDTMLIDGGTTTAYVFKAAPSPPAEPVFIARELHTTCSSLEVIAYVKTTQPATAFDLFTVGMADKSALTLRYQDARFVATISTRTDSGSLGSVVSGPGSVDAMKMSEAHRIRAVFTTRGSVLAQVDDESAQTILTPTLGEGSGFETFSLGPNAMIDSTWVYVALFHLEAK